LPKKLAHKRGPPAAASTKGPIQKSPSSPSSHHDALEFPDGHVVLLTFLEEGQQASVLQLPVAHRGAKVLEQEPIEAD
jgi:hypothetical protein